MSEHWPRLRWLLLGVAVALLVVYLLAQRQSVDVSYGQSPAGGNAVEEGSAGELSGADVPSVEAMEGMLRRDRVVRLPGSIAHWDPERVDAAAAGDDVRILVAPPGLAEDQRDRVNDVSNATAVVLGTEVTGGGYQVSGDDLPSWRAQFATADVTNQLVALLHALRDAEIPDDEDTFSWRAPTSAELAAVAADLRASGLHVAEGATLDEVPDNADAAHDGADDAALFAVFPRQPFGEPVPEYGPALAELFPDTGIYVMYGDWVEYHGPLAADFADVVGASFYGQFGDRLSRFAYPQGNVLRAYLDRVTDVRYAGLFDRPLPYQPFDPLRVTLPALPWLFAACVLGFLLLSARPVLGRARGPRRPPARIAALTTLAIELSALSHHAALVRAIGKLQAAREALADDLPDRQVRRLVDAAESELDTAATALGRADYRPRVYLAGGIS
ncbi:hypothetical protein [Actinophytocola gossypii]|uniref:DUF4350 domain-containing protein n=1 Tax=Actinophytocola gossypii TaxID=2812003 RepID=A0ABT2JCV1_9PSEU|nr:hypothetical protein [Actinophytocola gossypii]MCT2585703.1 hypothetical protein [Actinophytocola gossypii]